MQTNIQQHHLVMLDTLPRWMRLEICGQVSNITDSSFKSM